MTDREKVIRGLAACNRKINNGSDCENCPYYDDEDTVELPFGICNIQDMFDDALALLKEQEPRVIPLSELLTFDAKWQFNTPPYLCTEEIDTKRMWWRSWRDIYLSIRCEGTMGSNNYGTEWRCWTFHPTEEQRKAAAWDG